jgi:type II secretory pathway pseudopilin PulG
MYLRSQRGLTGLELLGAIAVLLLAAAVISVIGYFVASHDLSEKNICLTQLDKVGSEVQTWAKTTTPQNPGGEKGLCTTAKDFVEKYNKQCGERLGTLPVPTCEL